MKTKISNIIKENRFIDSKSYNDLSPKMKKAINEIFKIIENEQKDILTRFDGAIEKITASYNIKKEDIHKYFDKEINEQLGV
jgi:hypothetical protein